MRLVLLYAFLTIALTSTVEAKSDASKETHNQKGLWATYHVKQGEWLYAIVRKLQKNGIEFQDTPSGVRQILKLNPNISDKNQLQPGQVILIPIQTDLLSNLGAIQNRHPNPSAIQINFIENININIGSAPVVVQQQRVPAASTPAPTAQNIVEAPSGPRDPIFVEVDFRSFFNRLDATDSSSGGTGFITSELNTGLNAHVRHTVFGNWKAAYTLSGSVQNYGSPSGFTSLENASGFYFGLSARIERTFIRLFRIDTGINLRELPYFSATSSTEGVVQKAMQPGFEANLAILLGRWLPIPFDLLVSYENRFGQLSGTANASSADTLTLGAAARFNLFKLPFKLFGDYKISNGTTSTTTQSAKETGFGLGVGFQF